jgi:sugar O-acyltransferase (sialic acid O-acetyltransferase NeuD family)
VDNRVLLVGAFHEIVELCELAGLTIAGIVDNTLSGEYRGYPIVGNDAGMQGKSSLFSGTPIILVPDQPERRKALAAYYASLGFEHRSLISPRAAVSPSAALGRGSVAQSGVTVSAQARVGEFARINTAATLMHDVVAGDFVTIGPGAVVLGNARIGELSYIGANATILPGIRIGARSIVGAGAVVTKDVPDGITVAGNPARALSPKGG